MSHVSTNGQVEQCGNCDTLAAWKRWVMELVSIPSKQLSAQDKINAIVTREHLARMKSEPDRETRHTVYLPKIAERAGLPLQKGGRAPGSLGDSLRRLGQVGVVDHESYTPVDDQGNKMFGTTRIAVAMEPAFLVNPRAAVHVEPEQERNQGGPRVKCVSCGSENIMHVSYQVCADCGQEQPDSKHVKPVNPVDDQVTEPLQPVTHEQDAPADEGVWLAKSSLNDEQAAAREGMIAREFAWQEQQRAIVAARVPNPETPLPEPVPMLLARPRACRCNDSSKWVQRFTGTHCKRCEPAYAI